MDTEETRRRVKVSHDIIGHPHEIGGVNSGDFDPDDTSLDVFEGEHYEVLASTLWGDYHTPTIIRWVHGETDNFTNRSAAESNKQQAKRYVESNPEEVNDDAPR